jgi:hypothetical protein
MKLFKHFALASLTAACALAGARPAEAAVILTFGQSVDGPTITGFALGGVTTISGVDVPVTISQIDAELATPLAAFLTLTATSTAVATDFGDGSLRQKYEGNFTITSMAGGEGVNYLSGEFDDAVSGGGASLTMSASEPFNTVVFSSDEIEDVSSIRALAFGFADVTPLAHVEDETLGSFQASVAGTLSANVDEGDVPEPMSTSLVGLGMLGAAIARRRRR